ncbi:protease modulator HflK [Kosakonia arachidis]|uniref:protease modulator HflK n=1 Tax=Kosakonia arachidis TaxID=551989 RepID=UPI00142EA778|nr:protease modulator HflK [Kosakonia arachidis]
MQTCLYCLLVTTGAVYLFAQLFSVPGFWLPATRLLLATTFVALAFVENSLRCEGVEPQEPAPAAETTTEAPRTSRFLPPGLQAWLQYFHQHLATTLITTLLATVFAIANIADAQSLDQTSAPPLALTGIFILLCFTLLLIERMLSFKVIRGWQYQEQHTELVRAILSIFLLLTTAFLITTLSPTTALWFIKLGSLIVLLIAMEYLLRAAMAIMLPLPAESEPRFLTRSLFTALYQWPLQPVLLLLGAFHQRFGVDLRQIQAFRLIGKKLLPVTCGIAVLGWLLSGLTEVDLYQRGIYERFGRPVAVLPPGLHIGFPWPFGRVIPVENGAVHELQLSDNSEMKQPLAQPDIAEGPAPQSSWRLWDNSHATDQSQVIASTAMNSQNFQMVNTDIRVIWRVGLNDQDAFNSKYQTEDLPLLVRSVARQVLMTQFASKQLDQLLDEQRVTLAATLSQEIQQRLTRLDTGVELLFIRIEAIHPPAGAADAYHSVQAAQIAGNALIAREKGYAATVSNEAQRKARTGFDTAEAAAAENLSRAKAAATNFSAEEQAWQLAGEAFITERRYQILSQALAHTPLLILDNHLQGENEPVLDLRQYPALADSTAPQKARTK